MAAITLAQPVLPGVAGTVRTRSGPLMQAAAPTWLAP